MTPVEFMKASRVFAADHNMDIDQAHSPPEFKPDVDEAEEEENEPDETMRLVPKDLTNFWLTSVRIHPIHPFFADIPIQTTLAKNSYQLKLSMLGTKLRNPMSNWGKFESINFQTVHKSSVFFGSHRQTLP